MKRYDSYKDSGIEWIGEIPTSWSSLKIKRTTNIKRGSSPRPIDDPKYFDDEKGEYHWIRISDVSKSGRYLTHTEQKLSELGSSLSHKLNEDEIVMSISGSVGKVFITKTKCCIHDGFVTFENPKVERDFLYYLLTNDELYNEDRRLGTQFNINSEIVGNKYIPFPPISEQQKIVSFLDKKTSLIDSLIEKTQRKIELLKEKRTSLINEVVTKGLNTNVEMKDSGVEWIGEIPSGWGLSKLGFLSKPVQGIQVDVENQLYNQHEGSERFIRISDYTMEVEPRYVDSYPESSIVNEEDLVMVRYGSKSGKVYSGIKGVICNNVFRIEHNEKLYTKFLSYFLNQESFYNQIEMSRDNNTLPQVSHGLYKEMKITLPVILEQQQIIEYLDEQTGLIDKTITIEEKRIELLKEYRQSLISEVVTGKRKID